ncbi:uncharacterized protein LOC120357051 [Solenopsis invicta]|uniref:uncharacterized protein LOC120357051 n=1 Tax=Solenopsis invicta TaxID=13686 RepID=UPI00193D4EE5|nr:uncharacterized protein LOC120357051 [Solenopsis invicta]
MLLTKVEVILTLIGLALNVTNTASGRKPISAEKQVLIALWFMITPNLYRSICVKFGVGKAMAFRSVRRVTYALHCIAPRFIQWPAKVADNINSEVARVRSFPDVIGAMGHIKIRVPPTDSALYINQKVSRLSIFRLFVICVDFLRTAMQVKSDQYMTLGFLETVQ